MPGLNQDGDKRASSRVTVNQSASYMINGHVYPCEIIDLSPQGAGLRVSSLLVPGDTVNINSGDYTLPAKVVRSEGNKVGLWFHQLAVDQLNYLKWLCRRFEGSEKPADAKESVSLGKKVYTLKAETEKDLGLLGIFLAALRKNCRGYIKDTHVGNNTYQVEIYDSSESVSCFESIVMIWKADKLIAS